MQVGEDDAVVDDDHARARALLAVAVLVLVIVHVAHAHHRRLDHLERLRVQRRRRLGLEGVHDRCVDVLLRELLVRRREQRPPEIECGGQQRARCYPQCALVPPEERADRRARLRRRRRGGLRRGLSVGAGLARRIERLYSVTLFMGFRLNRFSAGTIPCASNP